MLCVTLATAAAAAKAGGAGPASLQEVVVTGSRGEPRVAADSSAAVDSFSGKELSQLGFTDLSHALQFLEPSLSFAGSVNAGGAANARGPTLMGLGQDEVLVLVNGKRRAASSLINFNATIGRGEVPVDISLIPLSAIDHVEVLRDGASAQYGSDAIAGVINIILKNDSNTGTASLQGGTTEAGGGSNYDGSVRKGFDAGNGGFLTLSAVAHRLDPLNRAAPDTRAGVVGRVTNQQGEDGKTDVGAAAVLALPIAADWRVYGNMTVAKRWSANTIQFRLPTVDPAVYPNGFLPRVHLDLLNIDGTLGAKGVWLDWSIDLSDTLGHEKTGFNDDNTANPSLGASSPTRFDAGAARYTQNVADLDVKREFALLSGATAAAGVEHRYETYRLRSGEAASYTGAGAFGFPGFNPPAPVDASRNAVAAYLDCELSLLPDLRIGAAARYDRYNDFGSRGTGKISLFYRPFQQLALRSTASTGFRAPSLQQNYFSTVTSQNNGGVLQNVGTFPVNDPVAIALGATPLKPETSRNYSAGLVWTPTQNLIATLDVFRIDISDRIALSETLGDPLVTGILHAHGITNAASARYFTNAADTRTDGFDLVAVWSQDLRSAGSIKLSAGYTVADSSIVSLRTNPVIAAPDPAHILLNTGSIDFLTEAQPSNKVNAALEWSVSRYELAVNVTRFGSFRYVPSTAPANKDQSFGPKAVTDLTAAVHLNEALMLSAGVLNLTDAYNDKVSPAFQGGTGLQYPESGGIGFEGRQYFLRVTASF
jgi:iron complex outermembrane receptor protein